MFLPIALVLLLASDVSPLQIEVLRSVTVYESEEHLNFPWVFRGPDGFLSMSCSIGQHTVKERSMALVSQDDGETWTTPAELAAGGDGNLVERWARGAIEVLGTVSPRVRQGGLPGTNPFLYRWRPPPRRDRR
jgi:hypothetical protein